ncbi:MAG: hypothetical protein L3K01_00575 [Thermoplasmata archaeon]|nr:hypothetical protein [Thermoplasmata archaeon]
MAKPTRKSRPRAKSVRARHAPPKSAWVPPAPGPARLRAPPTGHAVCRGCGRIVRLALAIADGPNLEAFPDRRPDGWTAEGVTLTVTGVCPSCQTGGVAPA